MSTTCSTPGEAKCARDDANEWISDSPRGRSASWPTSGYDSALSDSNNKNDGASSTSIAKSKRSKIHKGIGYEKANGALYDWQRCKTFKRAKGKGVVSDSTVAWFGTYYILVFVTM